MIISFIYGLFLLLLFCHTENFYFHSSSYSSKLSCCISNIPKKEINDGKKENNSDSREWERWVVNGGDDFLTVDGRKMVGWWCKNGNKRREGDTTK